MLCSGEEVCRQTSPARVTERMATRCRMYQLRSVVVKTDPTSHLPGKILNTNADACGKGGIVDKIMHMDCQEIDTYFLSIQKLNHRILQ